MSSAIHSTSRFTHPSYCSPVEASLFTFFTKLDSSLLSQVFLKCPLHVQRLNFSSLSLTFSFSASSQCSSCTMRVREREREGKLSLPTSLDQAGRQVTQLKLLFHLTFFSRHKLPSHFTFLSHPLSPPSHKEFEENTLFDTWTQHLSMLTQINRQRINFNPLSYRKLLLLLPLLHIFFYFSP